MSADYLTASRDALAILQHSTKEHGQVDVLVNIDGGLIKTT
jgi:hypothetical protein